MINRIEIRWLEKVMRKESSYGGVHSEIKKMVLQYRVFPETIPENCEPEWIDVPVVEEQK